MMISNASMEQEIKQQISSLEQEVRELNAELIQLPKGTIVMKPRKARVYPYLSYYANGKHRTQYIPESEIESIKEQIRHRDFVSLRLSRCREEAGDWLQLLNKANPVIKTNIVAGYIADEQNRSINMLRVYRQMEIDALQKDERDERDYYRGLCEKTEKLIMELRKVRFYKQNKQKEAGLLHQTR